MPLAHTYERFAVEMLYPSTVEFLSHSSEKKIRELMFASVSMWNRGRETSFRTAICLTI